MIADEFLLDFTQPISAGVVEVDTVDRALPGIQTDQIERDAQADIAIGQQGARGDHGDFAGDQLIVVDAVSFDGDATALPIDGNLDDQEVAATADAVVRWTGGARDELPRAIGADETVVDDPPDRRSPVRCLGAGRGLRRRQRRSSFPVME